jgi:hypothetical protein
MDFRRVHCTSEENIQLLFSTLDQDFIKDIPARFIHNVDEIGSTIGLGSNHHVIGPAELSRIFIQDTAYRE